MPYVSEFTQFMNSWLEQHPEELQEKQKGRALWWDKPQAPAEQQANAESKVAQKAYPYFSQE
ncbi:MULTISPECIES: DUF3460 family protein [Uliginosibacterium]|uniref:DUF3460 family protein n=1 Tax=Uliginosibacterium aquaticum TaxID=2731212 RepID=A0ABX2IGC8_9RHOO|nr:MULTISPECIES: DUF3460 family protein [Uliginosibacterium]MDO6388244.1 DUF3460 family protein [Uliginosibacterium sp. 31-12]NSL55834.1 DUF3460 family protein [Uliginosibacterium aquaticum]PLK50604.1 DUF3460 domain-containing protein [Uliginosibacterium sp. TH139]